MNENGITTDALVIALVVAIIAFLPLLTSWWVRSRAKRLRLEDVASQPSEHHPSWRSFAVTLYLYLIGCVPIFIFFASPKRDTWAAAFWSVFTFFAWALATYRIWILRHTVVSIGSDSILYETGKSKTSIPTNAVRRVFISAGHIVIEKSDTTRVALPMIFAHNEVLYTQLSEIAIRPQKRNTSGHDS